MDGPFIYDKFVTGKNFIGRKGECAILGNFITQGINAAIVSPPRTGKSSIIQQTLFNLRLARMQFLAGSFSVHNIRTVEKFLRRYGGAVIRMAASTPEEYGALIGKHLAGTHFIFDQEEFSLTDEVVSLNWDVDEDDIRAMLLLPYRIAEEKQMRMVLTIDEFQNIDFIEEGDLLLRSLDTVLREEGSGRLFSLILTGSRINAMEDILGHRRYFYRSIERLPLSPVEDREIVDHLVKGFLASGKVIDRGLLLGACNLFRNHLYYINHFVSMCDSRSRGYIMEPVLVEALACMVAIYEPRFRDIMDDLTTHQVSLLKAVIDGNTRLSGAETVRKYALNSSANVKRVKEALMKKEIIAFDQREIPYIIDPLFEYWVRKYYFEISE